MEDVAVRARRHRWANPRTSVAVFAVAAVAALTTSCAAGQRAATSEEVAAVDATQVDVGQIAIRGLAIQAPPSGSTSYATGNDAAVTVVIVNQGRSTDRLTSITSSAFGGWGAYANDFDARAEQLAASDAASASASPASTSSSAAQLPTPATSVLIAPGDAASFGTPTPTGSLLVRGLTRTIYTGSTVPMTFTFAKAGSVTAQVPVALTGTALSSSVPAEPSQSSAGG